MRGRALAALPTGAGTMTSTHFSCCTGARDGSCLFNQSGLGSAFRARVELLVEFRLDAGGDFENSAPGPVAEPLFVHQPPQTLQVADHARVVLGRELDPDLHDVQPDREERTQLRDDLLDLRIDRAERVDVHLRLDHRRLDPGRRMRGPGLGVHGIARDRRDDLLELRRLQLVALLGRDLNLALEDDLFGDRREVRGVERLLEVLLGDLVASLGVLEHLVEGELVGEVDVLAVLQVLDRGRVDEHLEAGPAGLPAGDHRVLHRHHGCELPRAGPTYDLAGFPVAPCAGSRATYFWMSPVPSRVIPWPTWTVQARTWPKLPPSSRPARIPSNASRTAASRSIPARYFCSNRSMTGVLLPPVLAALKLVSDPEGSVSNRWIPASSYPPTRSAVPNGRTPPNCVYCCL